MLSWPGDAFLKILLIAKKSSSAVIKGCMKGVNLEGGGVEGYF